MGICFFCPNGHPLNVKTELAGKVGFCPKCNVMMRIPKQSMREVDDKEYHGQPTAEAVVMNSKSRGDGASVPVQDQVFSTTTKSTATDGSHRAPFRESMSDLIRQVAQDASCAVSDRKHDVVVETLKIRELPKNLDVLWYVMSSDGQKYGPAEGAVLKSWISERRVGPKTLLLRTGWKEPIEAGQVFPEIVKNTEAFSHVSVDEARAFEGNDETHSENTITEESDILYSLRNQQRRTIGSLYVMIGLTFVLICTIGVLLWFLLAK